MFLWFLVSISASSFQLCSPGVAHIFLLHVSVKHGILRCLPDLAGRRAIAGLMSRECTGEQRCAGLLDMSSNETATMTALNNSYQAKFGFSFVLCARENKKEAAFAALEERLLNSADEEVHHGIDHVKKIARLRLQDALAGI